MTKKKILLLIPLQITASLITYTWVALFVENYPAIWRHYVAVVLFALLVFLFLKNFNKTVLATGLYLILGIVNLLSLTTANVWSSFGVNIAAVEI